MRSVLQDWVMELPLREQGTLVVALRGCDTEEKFGDTKKISRYLRFIILNPADPREVEVSGAFMSSQRPEYFKLSAWDHMPLHWAMHMLHAIEIVGYRHPDYEVKNWFTGLYYRLCKGMHVIPELKEEMIRRLSEDRFHTGEIVS